MFSYVSPVSHGTCCVIALRQVLAPFMAFPSTLPFMRNFVHPIQIADPQDGA